MSDKKMQINGAILREFKSLKDLTGEISFPADLDLALASWLLN
jgi:hypothetical protein